MLDECGEGREAHILHNSKGRTAVLIVIENARAAVSGPC